MIGANTGKVIDFGNINIAIISGTSINMLTNFIIMSVMLAIHVVLVLYIWPYKIAPDPDRPLRWYYPCVCGCLRGRNKQEQVNERQVIFDEESALTDASPPLLSKKTSN